MKVILFDNETDFNICVAKINTALGLPKGNTLTYSEAVLNVDGKYPLIMQYDSIIDYLNESEVSLLQDYDINHFKTEE